MVETMKNIYIYDIEVFKHDYLVCVVNYSSPEERYHAWSGDKAAIYKLKALFMNPNNIFGGFNNKHYDDYIVKAIFQGATTDEIKAYNDFIIAGGHPWEYPVDYGYKRFLSFDLRDDLPIDLSLKAIEGNLRLPILESSVPFDIDRPLTPEERAEVLRYCWHDVYSSTVLAKNRVSYLTAKSDVAMMKQHSWPDKTMGLGLTNAKLTAMYLEAQGDAPTDDERAYVIPANLNLDRIPKEVLDFFGKLKDETITDEDLFKSKFTLAFEEGMEIVYAFGGLHASLSNCDIRASKDLMICNWDVGSMYPSMMINNHLVSRAVARPEEYRQVRDDRIKAKHSGDKKRAEALKLVLNTAYGAMLNKYNKLYDPLMARSVCITGQLYLTDLIFGLKRACKSFRGLNFNTDGVMFSIHPSDREASMEVINEWQARTGLELEEDQIVQYTAKDVNNYIIVKSDGETKAIGGYVSLHKGGSIKSSNMVIVDKAVYNYFVNGTKPEDTVSSSEDIFEFQIIAKCGSKYEKATWLVNGEHKDVQRVNRIYASKDKTLGPLYKWKLKSEELRPELIANLPDNCLVDNENKMTLDDIDKQFYIDEARKRIMAYIGEEPIKKPKKIKTRSTKKETKRRTLKTMTNAETIQVDILGQDEPIEIEIGDPIINEYYEEPSYEPTIDVPTNEPVVKFPIIDDPDILKTGNIYAKLFRARFHFMDWHTEKSGVNKDGSKYFTLQDIVPIASQILYQVGLMYVITFTDKYAVGTLMNVVDTEEKPIVFHSPMVATSSVNDLGEQQIAQRRLLYLTMLDIADNAIVDDKETKLPNLSGSYGYVPKAVSTTVTQEQKNEVKKYLVLLREMSPVHEPYITQVVNIMKGNPTGQQVDAILKELVHKTNSK